MPEVVFRRGACGQVCFGRTCELGTLEVLDVLGQLYEPEDDRPIGPRFLTRPQALGRICTAKLRPDWLADIQARGLVFDPTQPVSGDADGV